MVAAASKSKSETDAVAPAAADSQALKVATQHQYAPNHYRTITSNSRIHILENASLVIRDVSKSDQGYYLCQAANNFGSLSSLMKLTVNGEFGGLQSTRNLSAEKTNPRLQC